jgi:hypothetical protein
MNKSKLIARAALNALGVGVYIFIVALFFKNAKDIFGPRDNSLIDPIIFLLLFVFSALVTSSLILGKPIMLYLEGAKKEGVKLLVYTGAMLLILLVLSFLLLFLIK